jgi:dolichol-phosphate mannosyltransferase
MGSLADQPEGVLSVDRFSIGSSHLESLLCGPLCRPKTIFNCIAHGGYSWQTNKAAIYATNFDLTRCVVDLLAERGDLTAYVHAGSSSEYGDNCAGPSEEDVCKPNSDYAISKLAATNYIVLAANHGFPSAVLRLYSVYGPWEDCRRLIPTVVAAGLQGKHAQYTLPEISRDFVYVDDACQAFVDAALYLKKPTAARIFNIATGKKTTLARVASAAARIFDLSGETEYTMAPRTWDMANWYGNPTLANITLGWHTKTDLTVGLRKIVAHAG